MQTDIQEGIYYRIVFKNVNGEFVYVETVVQDTTRSDCICMTFTHEIEKAFWANSKELAIEVRDIVRTRVPDCELRSFYFTPTHINLQ